MSTPILMRPTISALTLRNGERAITITGGPHRVIVRHAHADALIDDIEDALEQMEDQ